MDSLGLNNMEGYGKPEFEAKTFVLLTHLGFDIYYVRRFIMLEDYRLSVLNKPLHKLLLPNPA